MYFGTYNHNNVTSGLYSENYTQKMKDLNPLKKTV